jgi:hypothetical protein
MRSVNRELAPFRKYNGFPAFETPTDELVSMPKDRGTTLLGSLEDEQPPSKYLFVELLSDSTVKLWPPHGLMEEGLKVPIEEFQDTFRDLRRTWIEAPFVRTHEMSSWEIKPVLVIERDVDRDALAELLKQVVSLRSRVRVGFVYATPSESTIGDVLPPLELDVEGTPHVIYDRVTFYLRNDRGGMLQRDVRANQLHQKVFGADWGTQCYRSWWRIQRGSFAGTREDDIDVGERHCCSDANWNAIKVLSAPTRHRRSYARWRILHTSVSRKTREPNKKESSTTHFTRDDSYEDFLQEVVRAKDMPLQLEVDDSPK